MRTTCWIICLFVHTLLASGQVGKGDSVGLATIVVPSLIGSGATLGSSSLPTCNPALTICATPLPVTLLDFQGHRETINYVGLQWTTTSELSSKGFWVERSLGNASNFTSDIFVLSLQNNDLQKHYETTDTNSSSGKTFYRLNQIDLDGRGTYSKIIEVDGYPSKGGLVVYPNPGRGVFYLRYPPSGDGSVYEVSVYDGFGRLLFISRTVTIDLSRYVNGNYLIRVEGPQPMYSQVLLLK